MFEILLLLIFAAFIAGMFSKEKSDKERKLEKIEGRIQSERMVGYSGKEIMDREAFREELSKAGFRDETIEDMLYKVEEKKGSVSVIDAIDIIMALDPLVKTEKDHD